MKVELLASPVERSDDFQEVAFHIPKEEMAKVAELVIKRLYESEHRFVVELVANSYDAAPGCSPKIHWPSKLEPYFEVEDIGPGMSQEFMRTKYCQIFSSTKDQDNTKVGGWGMGRLSALAISESYGIISDDGVLRTTYTVFKGEQGMPTLAQLAEGPSQGPGVKVTVPIPNDKIESIRREGAKLLPFFTPAATSNMPIAPVVIVYAHSSGWKLRERGDNQTNVVVMGGYPYPIDSNSLPYNSSGRDLFSQYARFVIDMPIGSCEVTSNRERLRYTESTIAALNGMASRIIDEFHESFEAQVLAQPTLWLATREYARLVQELPSQLKRKLEGKIDYNGVRLTDHLSLRPADIDAYEPYQSGVRFFRNNGTGRRSSNEYDRPKNPKWDMTNCETVDPYDKTRPVIMVHIDKDIPRLLPTISHNLPVRARVYAFTNPDVLTTLGNPDDVVLVSEMDALPKTHRYRTKTMKTKVKVRNWDDGKWEDDFSWDIKDGMGAVYVDFEDGMPVSSQQHMVNFARENPELRPPILIGIPRSSFKTRTGYTSLEAFMKPLVKKRYSAARMRKLTEVNTYYHYSNDRDLKLLMKHSDKIPELKPIKKVLKWWDDLALRRSLHQFNTMNNVFQLGLEFPKPILNIKAIVEKVQAERPTLVEVLTHVPNPSKELIACVL